jgi:hypothetical protein
MRIFDLRKGKTRHFPETRGSVCFNLEVRKWNDAYPQALDDVADENLTPQQTLTRINAQMRSKSLHFLARRHREFAGSISASQLHRFINEHWDNMQAIGLTWKPSPRALQSALTAAEVERATRTDHEE